MQEQLYEEDLITQALANGCFYCKDTKKQFVVSGEGEDKLAICQNCGCEHKLYSYKFRIRVNDEKQVNWKSYQEVQAMQEETAASVT